MSEEVVRGELGWERQRARSDEMRLRYWAKIIRMSDDRLVKMIYRASKDRLAREEAAEQAITKTWYENLDAQARWHTEQVKPEEEWNELVRERITRTSREDG